MYSSTRKKSVLVEHKNTFFSKNVFIRTITTYQYVYFVYKLDFEQIHIVKYIMIIINLLSNA